MKNLNVNKLQMLVSTSLILLISCNNKGNSDKPVPVNTTHLEQPVKVSGPKFDRTKIEDVRSYLASTDFASYDNKDVEMIISFEDSTMTLKIKPINTSAVLDNSEALNQPQQYEFRYYLAGKVAYGNSEVMNPNTAISLHNWELRHCDANGWSHDLCRVNDTSGIVYLFVKAKWDMFIPNGSKVLTPQQIEAKRLKKLREQKKADSMAKKEGFDTRD